MTKNAAPKFLAKNVTCQNIKTVSVFLIAARIMNDKDAQSKFLINTFSYFSHTFLKCSKLDIFNLNYNQFFKEVAANIKNICTSFINHFAKFNLTLKCFYLVKDKNLQTL